MVIYGKGNFQTEVDKLIEELKLQDYFEVRGFAVVDEIAAFIPQVDVGVIPNRINPFTQLNFPVRIFEYIIYKKSVVVPRTQGIGDYFDEESIHYFAPENIEDLAETIYKVYKNKDSVVINNSYHVYQQYAWTAQKESLVKLVSGLVKK